MEAHKCKRVTGAPGNFFAASEGRIEILRTRELSRLRPVIFSLNTLGRLLAVNYPDWGFYARG